MTTEVNHNEILWFKQTLFVYSDEVFYCSDYVPLTSGPVNELN